MDHQKIIKLCKTVHQCFKWFVWGLRWLAIIVFSILFIAGISVKLPWKVLVCLAIIPVVGIFVPKKIQPWIWISITVFILAVWIWVKMPDSGSVKWQTYQFNEELEKLQSDQQIDRDDNAAVQYEQLLDSYGESVFYYPADAQAESTTFGRPWNSRDYPQLAEWIHTYDPAIEQLQKITQIPECRFDIPRDLPDTDIQMKRINHMKGWAKLLIRSANLDIAEGRINEALEKQLAVLKMAQHLYQQKNLLDQAAAFHLELFAARALQTFMVEHCRNPETLKMIEIQFSQLDPGWAKNWKTIVDHEKLIVKNIMGSFYETNEEGKTRIAHRAMFALQESLGYTPRALFLQQHEMDRLAVIGLWLSLPTTPQRMAKVINKRFDYYSLLSQKGDLPATIPIQYSWRMGLNMRSIIDWLAIERVKYFWALHGQNSRHEAVVSLVLIFSALKEYYLENNAWPESLQQLEMEDREASLIDPVYGKPFFYQTTNENFRLYSFGPNGLDDNGVNAPKENKDDIVFWPRWITAEGFNGDIILEKTSK